jgi:hypothetical protein
MILDSSYVFDLMYGDSEDFETLGVDVETYG